MSDHYPIELLIHSSRQTSGSRVVTSPSRKTSERHMTSGFHETSASYQTSGAWRETSKTLDFYVTSGSDMTSRSYATSDSTRRRLRFETSPLRELLDSYLTSKSYETADSWRDTTPAIETTGSRRTWVRIVIYLQTSLLSSSTCCLSRHCFQRTSLWQQVSSFMALSHL